MPFFFLCIVLLFSSTTAIAGGGKPLPEPLSLEYALALAVKSGHPDLLKADARIAGAEADQLGVEANNGLEVGVVGGLKLIEPSEVAGDQNNEDSYLKLNARKRLYDFGRTQAGREAAQAGLQGSRHRLIDSRQRRYLEVMRRYFDVLLADLRHTRDNEALAIAFIAMDKIRDKVELKQKSDFDLAKLERDYQIVRRRLHISSNRQRGTRAALALALNRPGELSSELKTPNLKRWNRPVPELDLLNQRLKRGNPLLKAMRAELERDRKLVAKAKASNNPVLSGSIGAGVYQREMGGYHPMTAELTLEIPLFTGGRSDAEAAKARSAMMMKSAELKALELELLQRVTDLWLELQGLKVKLEELQAAADYRELKLDRNRALYEMEVKADLGDSMVDISAQNLDEAEVKFRKALVWAEIEALTGSLLRGK